jgi:glycosyltransferase involved in cell wall biosynthesis
MQGRQGQAKELPPIISVVTPVYNGAHYLAECIESVLSQTYQNWEYVIVNNCSTDGTREIAQRYAEKCPRIRICDNAGFVHVIENHNIALRQMSPASKYCKILSADDKLFPDCLAQMVAVAEAHPSVGIVGAYTMQGTLVLPRGLPYPRETSPDLTWPTTVMTGREICRWTLLGNGYVFGGPSWLLFRADLVRRRQDFFDRRRHPYTDATACFDALQHSDFAFIHQVLTYSRRHDESITATFAERFETFTLESLDSLITFGPSYLTPDEYARRLRTKFDEYYAALARGLVMRRAGPGFLRYHREALGRLGHPLRWSALGMAVWRRMLAAALNPGQMTISLVTRLRGLRNFRGSH